MHVQTMNTCVELTNQVGGVFSQCQSCVACDVHTNYGSDGHAKTTTIYLIGVGLTQVLFVRACCVLVSFLVPCFFLA